MTNLHPPGWWLVAFCCVGLTLWLAKRDSRLRRFVGTQLRRCGGRLWARLVPEPVVDPEVEEFRRARRLHQLDADLARVRRILASDVHMSATRQLGNRLAYDWLTNELTRVRRLPQNLMSLGGKAARSSVAAVSPTVGGPKRTASVEILDVGWRT